MVVTQGGRCALCSEMAGTGDTPACGCPHAIEVCGGEGRGQCLQWLRRVPELQERSGVRLRERDAGIPGRLLGSSEPRSLPLSDEVDGPGALHEGA